MSILWGTINANGTPSDGGGFSVAHISPGEYSITFVFKANTVPAIVGSQTGSRNATEDNRDGIVFPFLTNTSATAITGENTGARQDRSFSFIAVGETVQAPPPMLILWGTINADGSTTSNSGGFTVDLEATGEYEITFTAAFQTPPAIAGSQTNSGNLTEDYRDGIVFPFLTNTSATAITGNNQGTQQNRSFSFIAIGKPAATPPTTEMLILWGTINPDGTIAGGSGGFWVGQQAPGMYVITFPSFQTPPAIVGSQTNSGNLNEDNMDRIVFPWVNVNYAVAITGVDGTQQSRSFSFIAIGESVAANPNFKK